MACLEDKYGQVWTSVDRRTGKVVKRMGFAISNSIMEKLMCRFEVGEAEEFKTLFLMAALDLVLCPTQCSRFSKELLPALTCASDARKYNWCAFVLEKLMDIVRRFAVSLYGNGFAGGCNGCTLFLAVIFSNLFYSLFLLRFSLYLISLFLFVNLFYQILYLDCLNRNALECGTRPRIKVWTDDEITKACEVDRCSNDGDFGNVGVRIYQFFFFYE